MGVNIYGLIDPRTSELRYVGFTRHVERRLRDHLIEAKRGRTRKCNWLRSLGGTRPEVEVLETVEASSAAEAERFWIAYFRMIGCDLTNLTAGGDGNYGWVPSEETKRRIGDAHRGRKASPEARAKMSASRIGLPSYERTPETRRRISAAHIGRKMPEGFGASVSARFKGVRKSDETRARMAAAQPLIWTAEKRAEHGVKMTEVNRARYARARGEAA